MPSESKRVMILTTSMHPLIGGAEIALEKISERLPDFDFDVITQRYSRRFPSKENRGNIHIHRVGLGMKGDKFLLPVFGIAKAISLFRSNEYRCIHAYQASYAGGLGFALSILKPSLPFVLTLQEGKDLARQSFAVRWLRELIIKRAGKISVISRYLKNYALSVNPSAEIFLIPNGVDDIFLDGGSEVKGADGKTIISISRLVEKNGIDDLISSLPLMDKNYRLLLAGSGPLRERLENLAARQGISDRVEFLGDVAHDEIGRYFKMADVFIRPSRSEGLGTAFLEAMAAGLPVIGTPVGGIPDFLEDKKTGLFCRPNAPESIAECVKLLFSDFSLRQSIIRNGRALVLREYTWESAANKLRSIYESV